MTSVAVKGACDKFDALKHKSGSSKVKVTRTSPTASCFLMP